MLLSGLLWYGIVTLVGWIVSKVRRPDVNQSSNEDQKTGSSRRGPLDAMKERSASGLFKRLVHAGVRPPIAFEISSANYPTADRTPRRAPIVTTREVNGATSAFVDRGLLDPDELFSLVWGMTVEAYFAQTEESDSASHNPDQRPQTNESIAATPPVGGIASNTPTAGWYADPFGRFRLRYWDGGWTTQVSSNERIYVDEPD